MKDWEITCAQDSKTGIFWIIDETEDDNIYWMADCRTKQDAKLIRRALLKSEYPELFVV